MLMSGVKGHDQIHLTLSQGNFREFTVLLSPTYCLTVAYKKISRWSCESSSPAPCRTQIVRQRRTEY